MRGGGISLNYVGCVMCRYHRLDKMGVNKGGCSLREYQLGAIRLDAETLIQGYVLYFWHFASEATHAVCITAQWRSFCLRTWPLVYKGT